MKPEKKLRVGFIVPKYYSTIARGGIFTLTLLVNALERKNLECSILAFDGPNFEKKHNHVPEKTRIVQGKTSPNKGLDFFLKIASIKKFAENNDILHVLNMDLNLVAGIFSFFSTKKIIVHFNGFDYFYPLKVSLADAIEPGFFGKRTIALQNKIKNRIIMHCSGFICLSKAAKLFYEKLGFDGKRIIVVPEIVEPAFRNERKKFNGKRILYAGVFQEDKGVEYLIRAMKLIKGKNTELWLAGDGSSLEKQKLERLVKSLGLEKRVRFLGWINHADLPKIFFKCDLFVHPGIWMEAFGRTIIEAMLAGLPVVATRIGTPAELVRQKQLLCEPKNPADLAKKINFVLSHKKFAEKALEENRGFASREFSEEKIVKMVITKYLLELNNK